MKTRLYIRAMLPCWMVVFAVVAGFSQSWQWAHSLDPSSGAVTDIFSQGENAWVTGVYNNSFTCDESSAEVPGYGLFLMKINAAGQCEWQRTFQGSIGNTSLFVDEAENVFLTGAFAAAIVLDGISLVSPNNFSGDVLIIKFCPTGEVVWARSFGSPNDLNIIGSTDEGHHITGDNNGSLYLGGEMQGEVQFDEFTLETQFNKMFLLKMEAATGAVEWVQKFEDHYAVFTRVACDAAGNLLATGYIRGDIVMGDFNLTTPFKSMFLAKFLPDGQVAWVKQTETEAQAWSAATSLAIAPDGKIVLGGEFANTIHFDQVTLTAPFNAWDGFIAAYTPDGQALWAKQVHSANGIGIDAPVKGITLGADGSIFMAGAFSGTFQFENQGLASPGVQSLFLLQLSESGNFQVLTSASCLGAGIQPLSLGIFESGLVVTGGFCDQVGQFGDLTLTSARAFLAGVKFNVASAEMELVAPQQNALAFPNPASEEIAIQLPDYEGFEELKYEIFDWSGRCMSSGIFSGKIAVPGLLPGAYSVLLSDDKNVWSVQFLKT